MHLSIYFRGRFGPPRVIPSIRRVPMKAKAQRGTAAGGRFRGGRGGRGGAAPRRNNAQQQQKKKTPAELDADLDAYMRSNKHPRVAVE